MCESFFQGKETLRRICQGQDETAPYIRTDRWLSQMMKMLRNDLIHTVKKYLTIDEEQVKIQISQEPAVVHAYIPVCRKRTDKYVKAI